MKNQRLTGLQEAMIDHDQDMARHDRNRSVEVNSYHANGDLAERHFAVSRSEGKPPEWVEGTWHLRLDNGQRITAHESKLDQYYAGWRELPIV